MTSEDFWRANLSNAQISKYNNKEDLENLRQAARATIEQGYLEIRLREAAALERIADALGLLSRRVL